MARFDLPTRTFTDAVEVPALSNWPGWICCIASDDAIWLIEQEEGAPEPAYGRVWRFDTDTLEITDSLELGIQVRGGIAAADAIWLGTYDEADDSSAVYRIDAQTREVTDVIPVTRTRHFAVFDGALWTGSGGGDSTLTAIDMDSRRVVETVEVPGEHIEMPPLASETVMWVHTAQANRIFRIDPVTATE